MTARVTHYFDYKSPYAYLAEEETRDLKKQLGGSITSCPYTLEIPKYLGEARLDAQGVDTVGTRNDHQWRRVKYSYMDCRREANRRGLTILGPRKIFDSRPANAGFLYAREQGDPARYHELAFVRFFRREFDLESLNAVAELLVEAGFDGAGFDDYFEGTGRARLATLQQEAEAAGVFGVPSYVVDGELFWGAERLPRVRERLGVNS